MAQQLKLEVVLGYIDRATKPIRALSQGTTELGREIKATRDQLKELQASQKNIQSFRTLKTASNETAGALKQQQEKVRSLARQMGSTETASQKLRDEFNKAKRRAGELKDKHGEQQAALQELRTKLGQTGISTKELGDHERRLKTKINETNTSITNQGTRLKRLTQQHRDHHIALGKLRRTQALAGNMAAGGAAGLAAGSSILYTGTRLLAPGIEFGSQMSELQAVARLDRDSQEFQALRTQAKDLGATTAFTASEVGAGQTFLARAGFTPEAIQASMRDVLSLALANNTDLARTADIASNISSAFKIDPEVEGNITRVADVLSGTAARANVDLEMLGDTMKYLGGKSDLGLTLEQAATMAGLLGNIGIQGSQAGTTTRALVNRLTAPAKAGREAMEELGLQVANAQGGMRELPDILRDINNATRDMGSVQRQDILTRIFGVEAGSGSAELVSQMAGGNLDAFLAELHHLQGENQRMADVIADNMGGDLKNLSSAWDNIGLTIQEQNDGPLRAWVQSWTELLRGIADWIKENPELTAAIFKTAAGLGMLIAAGGALTVTLASILGPIAMVRYALMAFAANPVFWVIAAAIAVIAGAAYLIYKNWEPIKGFFVGLWNEVKDAFDGGILGVGQLIVNWSPLGLFYKAFAAVMSWFGVDLPGKFTDFGAMLMQGLVSGIKNSLGAVKGAITSAGDATVSWFKDKLGIHSPSRVFAELGGFTMQGLAQGIQRQQGEPLAAVAGVSQRMASAADGIRFDGRRPLSARPAYAGSTGSRYEIHIHAAAGMNPQAIAQAVAAELDRRERAAGARARSSLYDQE